MLLFQSSPGADCDIDMQQYGFQSGKPSQQTIFHFISDKDHSVAALNDPEKIIDFADRNSLLSKFNSNSIKPLLETIESF